MLGLGSWQVERLEWKNKLVDELIQRTSKQAVKLPLSGINRKKNEFMPVHIYGRFDYNHELFLQNRIYEKQAGVHLLTPFIITDINGNNDVNKVILVDRGWLPFEKTDQSFRKDSQINNIIRLDGIIRFPIGQTSFVPDNLAVKNQWYFIDLAEISHHTGYELTDYYIMANDYDDIDQLPIGGRWQINLPNNHLEYAITWYSLAFILLVIFIIYHRKKD